MDRLLRQEETSLPELLAYIKGLPLKVPEQISRLLGREAEKEQDALIAQRRASVSPTAAAPAKGTATEPPQPQELPRAPPAKATSKGNETEPKRAKSPRTVLESSRPHKAP